MSRTMTVHEALCKVKVADDKILKLLGDANFIMVKKACETKINGKPVEEVEKDIQGSTDKIRAIVDEVNAIKAALSESNAKTMITVGGKQMSIASAIYYLNHGIKVKEDILNEMKNQYALAINKLDSENGENLDKKAEKYITSNYGAKEKVDPEVLREEEKAYKSRHSYELIDPLNLKKLIDTMEQEIDEFKASVDSAIQVSNATTMITID